MSTSLDEPPDGWQETMEENDWSDDEVEAWKVMHDARPGDLVLWADRSVAMEVVERDQNDDGQHVLVVDKPIGDGTYEVTETYNNGKPKFTSGIGRANNLHFVERTDPPRGLSTDQYEELVDRLVENAIDAFMRLDYEDWNSAVRDVVETWSEDVSYRRWRGYQHSDDWQDGDAEAIYESVVEHAMQQGGGGREEQPGGVDALEPREQAEIVLYNRVFSEGRQRAESRIVTSAQDYDELVDRLAHHTLDRIDRKNYSDARVASRDTISDWIDDRQRPAIQSIIEYGNNRFDDDDPAYRDVENPERERAFDILEYDVWELVQEMQRERGQQDPTLRGLTYTAYQDLVDTLVGQVMRRHSGGFLRTTVQAVVDEWADDVEAQRWSGHRHRAWADGDVEDIFASVAMHADADPFTFNPFASDKEKRMAVSALRGDVLSKTRYAMDNDDEDVAAVQADTYIDENLVSGGTYDELLEASGSELQQYVEEITESVEGDEVGWTFVDEIVESGGTVPQSSNDWVLIDYGVIREGERLRRLAWFDRDTGSILVLSGMATEPPFELDTTDQPYQGFHVQLIDFGADKPEFLVSDESLEDALTFVHNYVEADRADFTVIENKNDVYVRDNIQDEDVNAGGALDALVPNINLPGVDDISAFQSDAAIGAGRWLRFWLPEIKGLAAWGVLSAVPHALGKQLDGVRIEPQVDKKHGVGVHATYFYGADSNEVGVGGKADIDVQVRPSTFSRLSERYAPRFSREGFREGDIGKGALSAAGRGYDRVESSLWGSEFLDEFGGSVSSFMETMARGRDDITEERRREMRREFLTDLNGEEPDDVDAAWADLSDEVKEDYGEYVVEQNPDMTWNDISDEELGISAFLMRGLNAESVVDAAEFLDIKGLLDKQWHLNGSDYVHGEPVSFEEWQEQRYGERRPDGPETEAARMARYHKEVAANSEAPDPFESMGVEQPEDYDLTQYTDEFGNSFEEVSDKFNEGRPESEREEFEEGNE